MNIAQGAPPALQQTQWARLMCIAPHTSSASSSAARFSNSCTVRIFRACTEVPLRDWLSAVSSELLQEILCTSGWNTQNHPVAGDGIFFERACNLSSRH